MNQLSALHGTPMEKTGSSWSSVKYIIEKKISISEICVGNIEFNIRKEKIYILHLFDRNRVLIVSKDTKTLNFVLDENIIFLSLIYSSLHHCLY